MAEIINLRRHRKAKARATAEVLAADNRVEFGLSKRERRAAETERQRRERTLDGAKLDRRPPDDGSS